MRSISHILKHTLGIVGVLYAVWGGVIYTAGAMEVSALGVQEQSGELHITVRSDVPATFTSFLLTAPNRLVIDIPSVDSVCSACITAVDAYGIEIKSIYGRKSRLLRIIIAMPEGVDYDIAQQGDMLEIVLMASAGVPIASITGKTGILPLGSRKQGPIEQRAANSKNSVIDQTPKTKETSAVAAANTTSESSNGSKQAQEKGSNDTKVAANIKEDKAESQSSTSGLDTNKDKAKSNIAEPEVSTSQPVALSDKNRVAKVAKQEVSAVGHSKPTVNSATNSNRIAKPSGGSKSSQAEIETHAYDTNAIPRLKVAKRESSTSMNPMMQIGHVKKSKHEPEVKKKPLAVEKDVDKKMSHASEEPVVKESIKSNKEQAPSKVAHVEPSKKVEPEHLSDSSKRIEKSSKESSDQAIKSKNLASATSKQQAKEASAELDKIPRLPVKKVVLKKPTSSQVQPKPTGKKTIAQATKSPIEKPIGGERVVRTSHVGKKRATSVEAPRQDDSFNPKVARTQRVPRNSSLARRQKYQFATSYDPAGLKVLKLESYEGLSKIIILTERPVKFKASVVEGNAVRVRLFGVRLIKKVHLFPTRSRIGPVYKILKDYSVGNFSFELKIFVRPGENRVSFSRKLNGRAIVIEVAPKPANIEEVE